MDRHQLRRFFDAGHQDVFTFNISEIQTKEQRKEAEDRHIERSRNRFNEEDALPTVAVLDIEALNVPNPLKHRIEHEIARPIQHGSIIQMCLRSHANGSMYSILSSDYVITMIFKVQGIQQKLKLQSSGIKSDGKKYILLKLGPKCIKKTNNNVYDDRQIMSHRRSQEKQRCLSSDNQIASYRSSKSEKNKQLYAKKKKSKKNKYRKQKRKKNANRNKANVGNKHRNHQIQKANVDNTNNESIVMKKYFITHQILCNIHHHMMDLWVSHEKDEEIRYILLIQQDLMHQRIKVCWNCKQQIVSKGKRCGGCNIGTFCSRRCFKKDWNDNKNRREDNIYSHYNLCRNKNWRICQ